MTFYELFDTPIHLTPHRYGLRAGIFPKLRMWPVCLIREKSPTQVKQRRLAHPQLGLPSPLLRRTSAPQDQQTERKWREWLSPQEQLRSKVNRRVIWLRTSL
jgi:hypothetical protein